MVLNLFFDQMRVQSGQVQRFKFFILFIFNSLHICLRGGPNTWPFEAGVYIKNYLKKTFKKIERSQQPVNQRPCFNLAYSNPRLYGYPNATADLVENRFVNMKKNQYVLENNAFILHN